MEITFANKKLMKQMNDSREMVKVHGSKRAKKLQIVLTQLHAAPNLGIFAPPYSPPHRCHELTGNRKGQLSVDSVCRPGNSLIY
jgi:proteic killer suppression protein